MVDRIFEEENPLIHAGDVVLRDLPPTSGAFFARALRRLILRRWLLILSSAVILAFVLMFQLPLLPASAGMAVITAGAAFTPRENIFRQASASRRADERRDPGAIIDAMLDGLPAPVILLNAQGKVLRFNAQAKTCLPTVSEHEHLSRFIRDPGLLDVVYGANPLHQQKHVIRYEERIPIERHMEATIAWIGPASGKTYGSNPAILLSIRDLTEQERLNSLRTDFIANASHELRTPLASLLGFIETLQGPARNDAAARDRFLAIMAGQAQRMARLIDDLLSLSRIEMRLHLRPTDRVNLTDVVRHVAATLEPLAERSNITLHVGACDSEAVVQGDRDELVQAFSNLVENAIKYGKDGGNVWMGVDAAGDDRYAVSVRDDGSGIAEKHLPRLTERFYRANGGEKSGTGLGLAIVKHAVARHLGKLKIDSELGKGSTFTIVLAAAPE